MAARSYGTFIFGEGGAPALPEGWTLKESPEAFARAVSPDGTEHYLTKTQAVPIRVHASMSPMMAPGVEYADMTAAITLPLLTSH